MSITNTITITSKLEKGMHNLGRLLGRILDATTITMSMCSDIIDATYGIGKYAAPTVYRPAGITPEKLLASALYGNEKALGCAKLGELTKLVNSLALPEGITKKEGANGDISFNCEGDTLFIIDQEQLIYKGNAKDIAAAVVMKKQVINQEPYERVITLDNVLSKEETITEALAYIAKQPKIDRAIIWDKLMNLITVNAEEGELNPLRAELLSNCYIYSISEDGSVIDGILNAKWADIATQYVKVTADGKTTVIAHEGAMRIFPIYNGPKVIGTGKGMKLGHAIDILPFIRFVAGMNAVDTIDFKDIRKFVARASSLTSNVPAEIKEMDALTLIILGKAPSGDGFVSPTFAAKIQPIRRIRQPFFDVTGYTLHLGNEGQLPLLKVNEKEVIGFEYGPGEVILSDAKGIVFRNNTNYPAKIERFRVTDRLTGGNNYKDLRITITQKIMAEGGMKFRPMLREKDFGNQDIQNAHALIGKSILSILKEDLILTVDGKQQLIDMILSSQGIKLLGCAKNIITRCSEEHGFTAKEITVNIDGADYKAIIGYLPFGIEGLLWDKRYSLKKPVTMKYPYVQDYTNFIHGISELPGMTNADEQVMLNWMLGHVTKSGRNFNRTLAMFNGTHYPGTVITIDDFIKLTDTELLDRNRKAFTIVSGNITLARKLTFPSGEDCVMLFSRPTVATNGDYIDNIAIESDDRTWKSEMYNYIDQLRAIGKGLTVPVDNINESMQKLYDIALRQPDKAFRATMTGARWSLVIREEVKHGQCHIADNQYRMFTEKGITHAILMRTPTLYPTLEIVELRPQSELKMGSFAVDPYRNESICYCSTNVADAMNGDSDGDGIFAMFFTDKDTTAVAKKLASINIGRMLADNFLKTKINPNGIGWQSAIDSDNSDFDTLSRAFSENYQIIKQYTIDDVVDAIIAAAQNKQAMGPTTSNFWREVMLENAVIKSNMDAYKYHGSRFFKGLMGHLYLGRQTSQAALDGIKANVDVNINSFKSLMMDVLDDPKKTDRYITFAVSLGMSKDAIENDIAILTAAHNTMKKLFPGTKKLSSLLMSGKGRSEKKIIDKMLNLVIGKTDKPLTPAETKQLIVDIRTQLTGSAQWVEEMCPTFYRVMVDFVKGFQEPPTVELPAKAIAGYVAQQVMTKYGITADMLNAKGITRRALGRIVNNITDANDKNDKAVEFIEALFAPKTDGKPTEFDKEMIAVMYVQGNPKLGPSKAFGNILQACKDIMADDKLAEDIKKKASAKFIRQAIGEILMAEAAFFGSNTGDSFHYRVGNTILTRLNAFAPLRTNAKAWADSKKAQA